MVWFESATAKNTASPDQNHVRSNRSAAGHTVFRSRNADLFGRAALQLLRGLAPCYSVGQHRAHVDDHDPLSPKISLRAAEHAHATFIQSAGMTILDRMPRVLRIGRTLHKLMDLFRHKHKIFLLFAADFVCRVFLEGVCGHLPHGRRATSRRCLAQPSLAQDVRAAGGGRFARDQYVAITFLSLNFFKFGVDNIVIFSRCSARASAPATRSLPGVAAGDFIGFRECADSCIFRSIAAQSSPGQFPVRSMQTR